MSNDNITILLISNSKLLKNKFIESLTTERNQFSLMIKTFECGSNSINSKNEKESSSLSSPYDTERINISCLICDYSINEDDHLERYVQLIDANDKSVIHSLLKYSIEEKESFKFYVNGIVYLYDETNSDTFTYIESMHRELNHKFPLFIQSDIFTCLLCNMRDSINFNSTNSSPRIVNDHHHIDDIQHFIEEFNSNLQYISQNYQNTITGIRPIINSNEEDELKKGFDFLIFRLVNILKVSNSNENTLTTTSSLNSGQGDPLLLIRSVSNSLKSADYLQVQQKNKTNNNNVLNSFIQQVNANKNRPTRKFYEGDTVNNLRNGFGIYIYENEFFRYEGEWKDGKKHGDFLKNQIFRNNYKKKQFKK
jgi:hypothetical protein